MIDLQESQLSNRQQLSTGAAPDGTSLWVLSGIAPVWFQVISSAGQPAEANETYRVLVGPVLAGGARAIAIVTAAAVDVVDHSTYSVNAIEADIDDESGRVQLMFEVSAAIEALANAPQRVARVRSVAYQVTIHGTGGV